MTKQQRLVLMIAVLASFVTFLDGSVVNVALPAISRELGGGLAAQQWIVDSYLITLGALILLAGSLSDLFGRKRILKIGLIGFAVASLLCTFAPNSTFLIIVRGFQGIAGALLVPSSLALIISSFKGAAQGKAIGTWTAWTGLAFIFGPLLGGFMVDVLTWRLIFAINVLPIAVSLYLLPKLEQAEHTRDVTIDVIGAVLCSLGLSGSVFGLIEQPHYGWHSPLILTTFIGGLLLLAAYVWHERRAANAMLPLSLFKVQNFRVGNVATAAIYGGLSIATFLVTIFLQQVGGYSALAAGFSLLPVTIIMFFLSPRFGALSSKYGPRLFMALGPMVAAVGFLLMIRVQTHVNYWSQLLPGVVGFALGLSMTVAPLTTAVLSDVEDRYNGIASAVNNAISRVAGLVTIAIAGVIVGVHLDAGGFHRAIAVTAVLVALGGVVSAVGIRNPTSVKSQKS
jgi:EmrB/QacA subfamily drug resistance transporter